MKPICVRCKRFYSPEKNGTRFLEGMPVGADWKPYKLWLGDKWRCRGCGNEIIVGVGMEPVSEHYKPDFAEKVEALQPELQVNDC